ncbi:hypothetical protein AX767_07025 [Variovorax sp. PAMC 28711]|nr:hypothetical protein AX767_07025 [Variovorax sp. PAMC 28711]
MLHSTNLVRVCRDSGLSGSDIQGLVGVLASRRTAGGQWPRTAGVSSKGGAVTSIVEFARTLLATLR